MKTRKEDRLHKHTGQNPRFTHVHKKGINTQKRREPKKQGRERERLRIGRNSWGTEIKIQPIWNKALTAGEGERSQDSLQSLSKREHGVK